MQYCENCGNKVPETAKFCVNCGKKLESSSNETKVHLENRSDSPISFKDELFSNSNSQSASTILQSHRTTKKYIPLLSLILVFFTTAIPFYVLYHPGALYYPSHKWPDYKHVSDTWNFVFVLILTDIVAGIINRKDWPFLVSVGLSIIYIIGLYLYPIKYFQFIKMDSSVNSECLIFSILLMVLNIVVMSNLIRKVLVSDSN